MVVLKSVAILLLNLLSFYCQDNSHTSPVFSLAALPNGNLVSGSADNSLKIWDTNTGVILKNLTGHTGAIFSVTILFNTSYIASSSADFTIRIWDQSNGNIIQSITTSRVVNTLNGLSDGTLLSGAYDYSIKLWTGTNSWSLSATLLNHTAGINALAILKNGLLASASDDKTVKIWNISDRNLIYSLTNHSGAVFCLSVLNDGSLASGSLDNTINIWNPTTGVLVKKLTGHSGSVNSLGILSNGYLVSASNDKTIKIWDVSVGKALYTLVNHTSGVNSLTILLNGYIASGSSDLKIKIWNTTKITSPPINPIINEGNSIRVNLMILGNILFAYAIKFFY